MNNIAIKMDSVCLDFPKKRGLLTLLKNRLTGEKALFNALIDINLSVRKGEVLGIIGKNGSGKSTLLRVISGIYPPDNGTCYAAGSISLLANITKRK
jgi:ABC-type polysaccharide/polyol phosphate transport system ATPase subunit